MSYGRKACLLRKAKSNLRVVWPVCVEVTPDVKPVNTSGNLLLLVLYLGKIWWLLRPRRCSPLRNKQKNQWYIEVFWASTSRALFGSRMHKMQPSSFFLVTCLESFFLAFSWSRVMQRHWRASLCLQQVTMKSRQQGPGFTLCRWRKLPWEKGISSNPLFPGECRKAPVICCDNQQLAMTMEHGDIPGQWWNRCSSNQVIPLFLTPCYFFIDIFFSFYWFFTVYYEATVKALGGWHSGLTHKAANAII